MEPVDEPKVEKKKKKKRQNKERKEKTRSPGSKESPEKSSKDGLHEESEGFAENQNVEVIKDTKVFLEGLKRSRRLSSTWLADPNYDDKILPGQEGYDDHKVVLCETYPAEDSKIYSYEMDFDDEDYSLPAGSEEIIKDQTKRSKKKGKKKQKADELKQSPTSEISRSKSSSEINRDVERNRNSSSEDVNVDSRQIETQDKRDMRVSMSKKKKLSKMSLDRGKEAAQTEEDVAGTESPPEMKVAPEIKVTESKKSINLKKEKPRTKKRRETKQDFDEDTRLNPGKEDQQAVKEPASGLTAKESKRSLDLKEDSPPPKKRKETLNAESGRIFKKVEKKESRNSLGTSAEEDNQRVPPLNTELTQSPVSSSLEVRGGKVKKEKPSHHRESPDDPKEEETAMKNDTQVGPLVSYRSVFQKFRRNPRKNLCDYKLREIDEICETFFLNKRLMTIGHFPRSRLFKTSLKEIDQFCEAMALTPSNRMMFSPNGFCDSVYNKLTKYYASDKPTPTSDCKVKQSFIEYVIYEDVPENREVSSSDDSQSLTLPHLPAYSKKILATNLSQRKHFDL